uniref:Uncharacterized protein n=1 Tax=Meloidogyne incognita TaxID=6306 RepID=A0A914NRQ9_MELIC
MLVLILSSSQSAVITKGISFTGKPTVDKITNIETKPAGTEFKPKEAIVAIKLIFSCK